MKNRRSFLLIALLLCSVVLPLVTAQTYLPIDPASLPTFTPGKLTDGLMDRDDGGILVHVTNGSGGSGGSSGSVTAAGANGSVAQAMQGIAGGVALLVSGSITANLGTLNGASTAANQSTEIGSLATIAANTTTLASAVPTLGQKTMANSQPVTMATDQSAFSVKLLDSSGTGLTSSLLSGHQRLDVNLAAGAVPGATAPAWADQIAGVDGSGNLRALSTDTGGRLNINSILNSITANLGTLNGAATAANQSSEVTALNAIQTSVAAIPAKGAATSANSTPVTIASDQIVPVSYRTGPTQTYAVSSISTTANYTIPAGTNTIYVVNNIGGTNVNWTAQYSTDAGTTWGTLNQRRRDTVTGVEVSGGTSNTTGQALFEVAVSGLEGNLFRLNIAAVTGSLNITLTPYSFPSSSVSVSAGTLVGTAATGSAASGAPVQIGVIAQTAQATARTTGQMVAPLYSKVGVGAFAYDQVRDMETTAPMITLTTTTETTLVAAVASIFNDLQWVQVSSTAVFSGAPTGVSVDLRDTTGGTVRIPIALPAAGGAFNYYMPLGGMAAKQATVNTNWTAQLVFTGGTSPAISSGNIRITAQVAQKN